MASIQRIQKRVLDSARIRIIPKEGFSWLDRRFIRYGFADRLNGAELLLYFFLCSVSDHQGLSFYSNRRICRTLKFSEATLERARFGLIRGDLIRYEAPLYQVLSLPESPSTDPLQHLTMKSPQSAKHHRGSIRSLGEILEEIL
jgi:hypothetical protein